ncbi:AAA family ATPase [Qipengyuania flava]|uniref:AAA family ATPase n=1 Tax=Qipengyuania flava TaxID=192812 RepID=UPI001C63AFB9|nr:AAA family ATPase [Qipengyuania flava]QYJ06405.1 ATP-binding protein [Qipengyuania flava]
MSSTPIDKNFAIRAKIQQTYRAIEQMFGKRLTPRDVFTPRAHELNQRTYARRDELETALKDAMLGHKYIIVHGESGNGKTWLYKKVFEELSTPCTVINLAKLITEKSLNAVISSKLGELGYEEQTSQTQELDAGAKPGGIGANYKHKYTYEGRQIGAIEALALHLKKLHGKPGVVVLDNFEQIISKDNYVEEIAALIISADEDVIASTGIKFLIVGTPTNIMEMLSKVSDASTIANRFVEIPEVARLGLAESRYIMSQGFEKHLDTTFIIDKNKLYREISYKTDGIAQQVQELCLQIAINASKEGGKITEKTLIQSEKQWLNATLSADRNAVIGHMNSQETKVGRKDQTIYCLGHMPKEEFKLTDVENEVRRTFSVPHTKSLNIPQILADFQKGSHPIIRKSPRNSHYSFRSPKYKMVIRSMLYLDEDQKVRIR